MTSHTLAFCASGFKHQFCCRLILIPFFFLIGSTSSEAGPSQSNECYELGDEENVENIENLVQIKMTGENGRTNRLDDVR